MSREPLVGGLEDIRAVLQTAVLLARNLEATLHLAIPGSERLQIHFGSAPCPTLLWGLTHWVLRRLNSGDSPSRACFVIELGVLVDLHSVSVLIRRTGTV